ncbi:MAG TPA: radical SAM family heme chaperone HemW [Mycobacteriales bacterium]|jgi:oxygen-independent coproporphyrinogen-3 oxidase|nr:radical SAM family heme chaperone HemW [Mycobacteriales bacterium]
MPSVLPDGEAVPADGVLPPAALDGVSDRAFGVYVHVPFCRTRCGYCDFNTYTATELGGGASQASYADTVTAEIRLARTVLGSPAPAQAVFFGGGTPTLLPPADLGRILGAVRDELGIAPGAEITTEANPDSVTPASLAALREAGFTRISFGMQSAVPQVLATLERTHDPARLPGVVSAARAAGFESVSLDLIYGTPGESLADWQTSLDAVLAIGPDHVSAYALIVEDGTRLAQQVRRGLVPMPDDDDLADKYLLAEEALGAAGYGWYEVSNWARTDADHCRHNELYWRGDDWWGLGPGAHSHVGGVRWWNVKHPSAYAGRLATGASPAYAREVLSDADRRTEDVLLRLRLAEGLPLDGLGASGRRAAGRAVTDGLLAASAYEDGRAVLTLRGRLLADAVVRELVD